MKKTVEYLIGLGFEEVDYEDGQIWGYIDYVCYTWDYDNAMWAAFHNHPFEDAIKDATQQKETCCGDLIDMDCCRCPTCKEGV